MINSSAKRGAQTTDGGTSPPSQGRQHGGAQPLGPPAPPHLLCTKVSRQLPDSPLEEVKPHRPLGGSSLPLRPPHPQKPLSAVCGTRPRALALRGSESAWKTAPLCSPRQGFTLGSLCQLTASQCPDVIIAADGRRSQAWRPDPSGASGHLCREVMGRKPAGVDPPCFCGPAGPGLSLFSGLQESPTLERTAPVPQNEPFTPTPQSHKAAHGHARLMGSLFPSFLPLSDTANSFKES